MVVDATTRSNRYWILRLWSSLQILDWAWMHDRARQFGPPVDSVTRPGWQMSSAA